MPKIISGAAADLVGQRMGTEPIIVLDIRWQKNGLPHYYADRDIENIKGKITKLGGLDSIIKLKSGGTVGQVSVTISDEDFEIKSILDDWDVHMRDVFIYQTYPELGMAGKFLIFEGAIQTPISWDEGNAEVTLQVVSRIEDAEIGFSLEQGQFPQMADSAVGKAWPLCFGTPIRVPAVKIIEQRRGSSLTRYSIITRTELESLCDKAVNYVTAKVAKETFVETEREKIPADRLEEEDYNKKLTALINAITVKYVSLLNFQERMIQESPTQEDNILAYTDLCIDISNAQLQIKILQKKQEEQAAVIAALEGTVDALEFEIARLEILVGQPNPAPEDVAAHQQAILDKLQAEVDLAGAQNQQTEYLQEIIAFEDELDDLLDQQADLAQQLQEFVLNEIWVDDGEKFPQGESVDVIVQGLRLRGVFDGRKFTISEKNLPTYTDIEVDSRQKETPNLLWIKDNTKRIKGHYVLMRRTGGTTPLYYVFYIQSQGVTRCVFSPVIWEPTDEDKIDFQYFLPEEANSLIIQTSPIFLPQWDTFVGTDAHLTGLDNLPDNDWSLSIGDSIYLADDYQDKYVANLIPSNTVYEVMAKRTINGVEKLQPIPSSYYAINLGDSIAGQTPTTITFQRPLTEYIGENWQDQIYVTLTSSQGANTALAIKYLIETYSDYLTVDASSFANVSAAINKYPSNFALLSRSNLLSTIEDIAFQARCAVYSKGQIAFIKYLAQKPGAVEVISESDVDFDSMKLSFGSSDELVTHMIAEWKQSYAQSDPYQIVLRNNIGKYGDIERTFTFSIYNIADLVAKSAHFWLMRYSNTWKKLQFTTPIHKLKLEVWDGALMDFQEGWISHNPVIGVVERSEYDSGDRKIDFEIWVPVRFGEMSEYPLAYPASSPAGTLYPQPTDLYAGGDSNGELVQGEVVFDDDARPKDLGPKLPSDSDDSTPVDVSEGRGQVDYNIPDQREEDELTEIEIDIRTTRFIDSLQPGIAATADTAFSIGPNEDDETSLLINTTANLIGLDDGAESQTAQFDHKYDSDDGKWLPRQTFLAED